MYEKNYNYKWNSFFFKYLNIVFFLNLESKSTLKGLGGFQNFKKSIFFLLI